MFIRLDSENYYAYSASHRHEHDRETIVFVHGTAMDHTVWALQSRYFAYHGYNVLALDLPGHGLSSGDPLDRIEDYGAWVVAMVKASQGSCFHLVGHSMGALICLEAMGQNTNTLPLGSLSLLGFSYPMTVTPTLLDAAEHDPSKAYSMMTQWSHTSTIGGEPNPGFWSPGSQLSMMENSRQGAVFIDLTACHQYDNGAAAFAGISCPIMFISGIQDKMAPCKTAQKEADKNPTAGIVKLPNCGHAMMSENPDGVREALWQFITSQGK